VRILCSSWVSAAEVQDCEELAPGSWVLGGACPDDRCASNRVLAVLAQMNVQCQQHVAFMGDTIIICCEVSKGSTGRGALHTHPT
jgi:hypothetical protein